MRQWEIQTPTVCQDWLHDRWQNPCSSALCCCVCTLVMRGAPSLPGLQGHCTYLELL
jgi:hypothetical protein